MNNFRVSLPLSATDLIIIVAVAALSGCLSAAQQAAEDQKTCASYGYQEGSTAFSNCMMISDQRRKKAQADWQAEQNRKWDQQTAPPAMQECSTTESVDVQGDASMDGQSTRTKTKTVCVGQ
ncbi:MULTISPECIES: hypothetical protein [Pseudomonas]|uniref:hypothetical protein n=1 Tax=Pseudomonas TaxID=286 RepID=UPI0011400F2F|nr:MULTISPECIES: hypothetical protein [Pseudomonas]MDR9861522.1 hypothetical protein [Pseudomonas baetica]